MLVSISFHSKVKYSLNSYPLYLFGDNDFVVMKPRQ